MRCPRCRRLVVQVSVTISYNIADVPVDGRRGMIVVYANSSPTMRPSLFCGSCNHRWTPREGTRLYALGPMLPPEIEPLPAPEPRRPRAPRPPRASTVDTRRNLRPRRRLELD